MRQPRFQRAFFRRDPVGVARALLGQRLVSLAGGVRTAGIVVETEAYLGVHDRAAHTYGGRNTARNRSMWGDGGHAYVYFVYGMHHCMNVVAGRAGQPVAVLLRALVPTAGIDVMARRRPAARRLIDLCAGPAKLCQALGIDRSLDGEDLVDGSVLFLEAIRQRAFPSSRIRIGPRVGIDYAGEWKDRPLRFRLRDADSLLPERPNRIDRCRSTSG